MKKTNNQRQGKKNSQAWSAEQQGDMPNTAYPTDDGAKTSGPSASSRVLRTWSPSTPLFHYLFIFFKLPMFMLVFCNCRAEAFFPLFTLFATFIIIFICSAAWASSTSPVKKTLPGLHQGQLWWPPAPGWGADAPAPHRTWASLSSMTGPCWVVLGASASWVLPSYFTN